MGGEVDNDWCVEDPNEEWYNPTKRPKGTWMPEGKVILELLERIQKEKILELKWKCPGRRPPASEQPEEEMDIEADMDEDEVEEEKEDSKSAMFGEFDFDDAPSEMSAKITPRRTPGSGKLPRPPKRVACMDNVLNKMRTQRKQNEAARASRGLGIRGRRTPIYSSGTPKFRSSLSQSPFSGATPTRPRPFDLPSDKPTPPSSKPVPMEFDRSPAVRPTMDPTLSTPVTTALTAQNKVTQPASTSACDPVSTGHSASSNVTITTSKVNQSSNFQHTSHKENTEYREPIPKLLLKIPPPNANQPMTSTLIPQTYSRTSASGQGMKKSPTAQSGTQKQTPSKPKTPPLYTGAPKTPPTYQNPPRTPPVSSSGSKTPPASSPGMNSPTTSPKAYQGHPKTPPAYSSGYTSKANPFFQQQHPQQSQVNPPTSHPPPAYLSPHAAASSPQTSQHSQRLAQMSRNLSRMSQGSQYSQNQSKPDPFSQAQPRNLPLSQNQPRTPPISQNQPRTPPISQNQPRTPPISQNQPRAPSLTLTIPKNASVSQGQPRTPPALQNQPRTPPVSQLQQRNPALSFNPQRTPPISQAQPRTPPASQGQSRTPPLSQNSPRTPPFSQSQPKTPPYSQSQPRTSPVSHNPPRTPPVSQFQPGPHHPQAAHPLYQFQQMPPGQRHPPGPRQMSPSHRMPSVTSSQAHINRPRSPYQSGVHPSQFSQSRPKTPPAYHTVVSRAGPFGQPQQTVHSDMSTHGNMGHQQGGANPVHGRTPPASPRQPPISTGPQVPPPVSNVGLPSAPASGSGAS